MAKKTNIEYLRELISDHVGEKHKDECLEFLESIENDQNESKVEKEELEQKVKDLEEEDQQEAEYDNEIDTGFPHEPLYWKCGNLSIDSMMEDLQEALKQSSPLEISRILKNR